MYCGFLLLPLLLIGAGVCIARLDNEEPSGAENNIVKAVSATELPSNVTTKDKVHITVYYETLCPPSRRFFHRQLKPTVLKLADYMDVTLIPYGNAETTLDANTTDQYTIECQHGAIECYGNKVHACANFYMMANSTKVVLFNSCLMENTSEYSDEDIRECGEDENVSSEHINDIIECANSTTGFSLLKIFGNLTSATGVEYVPHLTFGDSVKDDRKARQDLLPAICNRLDSKPEACIKEFVKLMEFKRNTY